MESPQITENVDGSTRIKALGHDVTMNADGTVNATTKHGTQVAVGKDGAINVNAVAVSRVEIYDIAEVAAINIVAAPNGGKERQILFNNGATAKVRFNANDKFVSLEGTKLEMGLTLAGVMTLKQEEAK
ncbi:hypothetical protein C7416_102205 [Cupriavidus phytorum]|uniref:Uncharacterized protein n=1 Tax=Cupriavidus phytorum TaxID=3024399 RepID=A0A2W7Q039_9BURK|nr:hypothetical protein [Cupriavidus alkaliphilus]PZX32045.1 hypothetical protein C7416_102205 [Cupriavidus alkaliphilus]